MTNNPPLGSLQIGASALGQMRKALASFIDEHINPVARPRLTAAEDLHATAVGYLDRVRCWLRSLGKLDQASDFQAIDAAARSLFEIVVDLTLLKHDVAVTVAKMLDWEVYAKHRRFKHRLEVLQTRTDQSAQQLATVAQAGVTSLDPQVAQSQRTLGLDEAISGAMDRP